MNCLIDCRISLIDSVGREPEHPVHITVFFGSARRYPLKSRNVRTHDT
jgi:hypothetical protein